MKNILLLTPVYPSDDHAQKGTAVVHYFAREWVKMGYRLLVFHYPANFPRLYRIVAAPLCKWLESKLEDAITLNYISKREFTYEGVDVVRIPMLKYRPHSRYPQGITQRVAQQTIEFCLRRGFKPDIVLGHWANPQVDIMRLLKAYFNIPASLVLHSAGEELRKLYGTRTSEVFKTIDVWGFRSLALKERFEQQYQSLRKCFICCSGVSKEFFYKISPQNIRTFEDVHSFIYVGALIERKYPVTILEALRESDIENYVMTYIGDGQEQKKIANLLSAAKAEKPASSVSLLGRIPRADIRQYLLMSDIFIMISRNEVFGLVYLEAMATGCIPIAARGEGFDGIIKEGYNGFLCESGNKEELVQVINHIRALSPAELVKISQNAMSTACQMTDEKVAHDYITNVLGLLS